MSTLVAERGSATQHGATANYLTFKVGQDSYGIAVLKVREIIRLPDITSVPQMPPCVKGVIDFRGKTIPVADLRLKFQPSNVQDTERTSIVVVQVPLASGANPLIGLIVDAVEEVARIPSGDIESTSGFGADPTADHILGVARVKGTVTKLLDLDRIVPAESLASPNFITPPSGT